MVVKTGKEKEEVISEKVKSRAIQTVEKHSYLKIPMKKQRILRRLIEILDVVGILMQ